LLCLQDGLPQHASASHLRRLLCYSLRQRLVHTWTRDLVTHSKRSVMWGSWARGGASPEEPAPGSKAGSADAGNKMQCHYEVLELSSRAATAEEIKKQYKRLALRHHPDKNVGKEELATEMFKKVSASYAVLSDPQERKWYDDHRDAILRGGSGVGGGGEKGSRSGLSEDVSVDDLWLYFDAGCFNGFEERADGKGFYQVYAAIFQAMISQEDAADTGSLSDAPPFGDASSSKQDVSGFYNYWLNFVTSLSFSWEDEYNPSDAPNRDVRRAIEKENKKAREAGRKKYVDVVRALAAYVKKRDPRMQALEAERLKKKEDDEARRKQAQADEQARRAEARQRRLDGVEEFSQAERLRREEERKGAFLLADLDSDSDDDGGGGGRRRRRNRKGGNSTRMVGEDWVDGEEDVAVSGARAEAEEEEEETFECEICSKSFKSPTQLEQHNQSKVHRKNAKEAEKQGAGKLIRVQAATKASATSPRTDGGGDDEDAVVGGIESMRIKSPKKWNKKATGEDEEDEDGREEDDDDGPGVGEFECGLCKGRFITRNLLFSHLKATGHAQAPEVSLDVKKKVKRKAGIGF